VAAEKLCGMGGGSKKRGGGAQGNLVGWNAPKVERTADKRYSCDVRAWAFLGKNFRPIQKGESHREKKGELNGNGTTQAKGEAYATRKGIDLGEGQTQKLP